MRRVVTTTLFVLAASAVIVGSVAGAQPDPASRWIVQLAVDTPRADFIATARAESSIRPTQRFSHVFNGFAAMLTDGQRAALAADPRVKAIVPDLPIHAAGDPYPETTDEIQPGIRRVGALENADRAGTELDVDIAVLDTGVQPDNAELNVKGGYNCTDPSQDEAQRTDVLSWDDSPYFGHGTHVSGIAAAMENGRGVAGVAQGARLWMIKVLTDSGNGFWSYVICGLEHVAAMRDPTDPTLPRIEVVNMSIAAAGGDDGDCGLSSNDLFHQAVCRVSDAGITMVAAAGNEARDTAGLVPGSYDEVITVAAMADWDGAAAGNGVPPTDCLHEETDDLFAAFSDFGADVDLIAPGVCVLSTLPVDSLGLMSGTSMATPHVTGGAALYYLAEARAGRPRPTPQQVRAALIATGTLDWQTGTDPDRSRPNSIREPALRVSSFDLAPALEIGTARQIVRTAAGTSITVRTWAARLGGFDGAVDWHVEAPTLPQGSSATFFTDPPRLVLAIPATAAPGGNDVVLTAASTLATAQTSFRLVVFDGGIPGASGPAMYLRSSATAGATALPVRVSWPAVGRARRYQLQQSVDGDAWKTIAKPRAVRFATSAVAGRRYQFRVRAKVAGTWMAWLQGPSQIITAHKAGPELTLTGSWSAANGNSSFSEYPVYSTDGSASASLTFTGRSVAWIASRGTGRGVARVMVDGAFAATVDLIARSKQNRVVVFSRSWPYGGAHTLRIEVTATPIGRPRVDVDAVVVGS